MADQDKKPAATKRLGGLNSGPGAGRLGEQHGCHTILTSGLAPTTLPAASHIMHAALPAPAGNLRTGDGAGPSTAAAASGAAASTAAGGARKVGGPPPPAAACRRRRCRLATKRRCSLCCGCTQQAPKWLKHTSSEVQHGTSSLALLPPLLACRPTLPLAGLKPATLRPRPLPRRLLLSPACLPSADALHAHQFFAAQAAGRQLFRGRRPQRQRQPGQQGGKRV